jgi:hypothetical protein
MTTIDGYQCPLWVISGHVTVLRRNQKNQKIKTTAAAAVGSGVAAAAVAIGAYAAAVGSCAFGKKPQSPIAALFGKGAVCCTRF